MLLLFKLQVSSDKKRFGSAPLEPVAQPAKPANQPQPPKQPKQGPVVTENEANDGSEHQSAAMLGASGEPEKISSQLETPQQQFPGGQGVGIALSAQHSNRWPTGFLARWRKREPYISQA